MDLTGKLHLFPSSFNILELEVWGVTSFGEPHVSVVGSDSPSQALGQPPLGSPALHLLHLRLQSSGPPRGLAQILYELPAWAQRPLNGDMLYTRMHLQSLAMPIGPAEYCLHVGWCRTKAECVISAKLACQLQPSAGTPPYLLYNLTPWGWPRSCMIP